MGDMKNTLKNELSGLRGSRILTRAKQAFARALGRASEFNHLPAALAYTLEKHQARERPLTYWEFGTGSGNTLQRALSVLKNYGDAEVCLFDSFKGLPPPTGSHDAHVTWSAGDFAFSTDYIRGVIRKNGFPLDRVRFVEGFFEESLTPALAESLRSKPPAFVTLDLDYYSSTKAALDFLQPLFVSGCNVFFDDLWSFDGHPEHGQLKALREFNAANKRGQLVPNTIFPDRIYSYFNWDYEFARR
jgi:hypothetical protein